MPSRHLVAYIHTHCYKINPNLNIGMKFKKSWSLFSRSFKWHLMRKLWLCPTMRNKVQLSLILGTMWSGISAAHSLTSTLVATLTWKNLDGQGAVCACSPLPKIRVCPKLCESVAIFSHSCSNFLFSGFCYQNMIFLFLYECMCKKLSYVYFGDNCQKVCHKNVICL